jgi:hypothetical protein
MTLIYVKTKPDRRAYYEGRIIPNDKFMPVQDTPYMRRLIDHWQDVILEEGSEIQKRGKKRKIEQT